MATFMQRLAGHAAGVAPSVDADTIDGLDSTELLALGGGGTPASPVGVATSAASFTSSDSASWIDVPGASTSLTVPAGFTATRSEEHTSELQSLMRISYAVFCLKKKKKHNKQ